LKSGPYAVLLTAADEARIAALVKKAVAEG
jgi:hypothetical protein